MRYFFAQSSKLYVHLFSLKFCGVDEKNMGFLLILKSYIWWENPKVIWSHTFNSSSLPDRDRDSHIHRNWHLHNRKTSPHQTTTTVPATKTCLPATTGARLWRDILAPCLPEGRQGCLSLSTRHYTRWAGVDRLSWPWMERTCPGMPS